MSIANDPTTSTGSYPRIGTIWLPPGNAPLDPVDKLYNIGGILYWNGGVITGENGDGHSLDAVDGSLIDALYVNNIGRVGIGTSSPLSVLHAKKSSNKMLRLKSTLSPGAYPYMSFYQNGIYAAYIQSKNTDFTVYNRQPGNLYLGSNNQNKMTITSTGNVGVGITNPLHTLQVYRNSNIVTMGVQNVASGFGAFGANDGLQLSMSSSNAIVTNYTGDLSFGTNNLTALTIKFGKVGIGLTNPTHILQVVGSDASGGIGHFVNTVPNEDQGIGIYGACKNSYGYGYGGYFKGGKTGGYGLATVISGGNFLPYYGLTGSVRTQAANYGNGTNIGVFGYAEGGERNYGIFGANIFYPNNISVVTHGIRGEVYPSSLGTNYAGYFNGDVETVNISKSSSSFKIDHPLDPENKYLYHSTVESPDMMNIYNGNIILDAEGNAIIEMPDWFKPLNMSFRYQLTAIGKPGPNLYIAEEISDTRFKIAGGTVDMEVSWQVTGIRQDTYARDNRIKVEVDKPEQERGKYRHPLALGKPIETSINYRPEEEQRMQKAE